MKLSKELTGLVRDSVAVLGRVVDRELGRDQFQMIESLRLEMAKLRALPLEKQFQILNTSYAILEKLSGPELRSTARAFTLMLELMNACENAYRSHRLRPPAGVRPANEILSRISSQGRSIKKSGSSQNAERITYVLTAHPTEARSPQNIEIFHQIQQVLTEALLANDGRSKDFHFSPKAESSLFHLLEVAWRTNIVRSRSPKVKDEAEHIYSMLFREDILLNLLDKTKQPIPFYVRSWVGGDKDGHPGVNEKTLIESLSLSRAHLLRIVREELGHVRQNLGLVHSTELLRQLFVTEKKFERLKSIRSGDGRAVRSALSDFSKFKSAYLKILGAIDPRLERLSQLFLAFPAMVVPLELRESSDVLMSKEKPHKKLAIYKMLSLVHRISLGGDPRSYARGFIISMTDSIDHIRMAARFQKKVFGQMRLPIIPLFEQSEALRNSDKIILQMVSDSLLREAAIRHWDSQIEMMVGYSDSSKEAGALSSRIQIAETLPKLEKVCEKSRLTPIFFHGSGGSIDRGGGTIEDQTAWWPRSALRHYKVTVQGEMVERSFASLVIAERQLQKITESISAGLKKKVATVHNEALDLLAKRVSQKYREAITAEDFLHVVEVATPYSYLNILKIGSRPAKRTKTLTVDGLRAIPWVLCWTQTRVLFQTWWGVGSAWSLMTPGEKIKIKKSFKNDQVFTSYIKALGFTLAKVELAVWRMYLEKSQLSKAQIAETRKIFESEYFLALKSFAEISGEKNLTWSKPWLGESISLRSPMIHPLNMIQILAQKNKDLPLLRATVTGISSGMMTTG